jgi:cell division inhibitor SepF
MGFADLWNRTLVYFGIAEEDEYWDEDGYITHEELERTYGDRPNVRRLPRRGRGGEDEDWTDSDSDAAAAQTALARRESRGERQRERDREREQELGPARPRRLEAAPNPNVRVHLILPRSFNDAQQIADKFKEGIPVILNLQATDQELSKRLIDFASGLTYALSGGMQRVADKVFLLTPRNVEVSAEERARILERGGFFNQA